MNYHKIISKQPNCDVCDRRMEKWNPFSETHEHIECTSDKISIKLIKNIRNLLEN